MLRWRDLETETDERVTADRLHIAQENPLTAIRCGDASQTHAGSTLHRLIRLVQTTANLANVLCNIAGQVLTASLPDKGAIYLVTM